jgi:hypothetical protein
VNGDEIKGIWDDLKRNAELLYKKKTLTPSDLQQIQSYIIISLPGGIFIPPRRSKDYVDMMIKDIDKNKDNYIEKSDSIEEIELDQDDTEYIIDLENDFVKNFNNFGNPFYQLSRDHPPNRRISDL